MNRSRRRFLELTGVGTGLLMAGCTGSTDESTSTLTSAEASTETPLPTTAAETETNTPEPEPTMSTVFHFSKGIDSQKHAVANVANLLGDESTEVENIVLVANGKGIKLLSAEESDQADRVRKLIEKGVSFRACENSMASLDVSTSDLIEGVETVPAGVGELTKLQARDNYAYIETP